jgi:hypothetical protein
LTQIILVGKQFITILINGQRMDILKTLTLFNDIVDLDVINLDGIHTITKRGREKVEYQHGIE